MPFPTLFVVKSGSNGEPPTLRHRVPRIDDQVDDDLLQLTLIGPHEDGGDLRKGRQGNGLPQQRAKHGEQFGHHPIHVKRRRLQHLPTAERQELPRQQRGTLRGLLDVLHALPNRVVGWKRIEEEGATADNHREQVVELVGDTTREVPDRLHLPGLHELGLRVRQIIVGALDILIEASILQRDCRVSGERLGELLVGLAVDPPRPIGHDERAHEKQDRAASQPR